MDCVDCEGVPGRITMNYHSIPHTRANKLGKNYLYPLHYICICMCQTYGYLTSHRTSLLFGQYEIILLGE